MSHGDGYMLKLCIDPKICPGHTMLAFLDFGCLLHSYFATFI